MSFSCDFYCIFWRKLYESVLDCLFLSGPSYGYRGKVLLAFEGNGSSKIGVRFDKSIPDGNDLGGLCEENHGFFCSGDLPLLYGIQFNHVLLFVAELF